MPQRRFDLELIVHQDQPMDELRMALDEFAGAGVEAVSVFHLIWEGSMAYSVNIPEIFDPGNKNREDSLRQHIQDVVEEISKRGMRPKLLIPILQYPDSLLKDHPEWLGEGVASGSRCEFNMLYDDRREKPVCPAVEEFWQWFEERYQYLFKALPHLGGLTVLPSEGRCDLWACRCSRCVNLSYPERILAAVTHLDNVISSVGSKELEMRTYLSGWRLSKQPEWLMPLQGRLPEDIVFSFRAQFGDDHYLNPPHPFVEHFTHPHKAMVVDLYNEKRGFTEFPVTIVEWLKRRIAYAAENGISHFIGRVDMPTMHPRTGRYVNLNFAAAAELARDPERPVEDIYNNWANRRFGKKAAPVIVRILRGCAEIINGAMFVKGLAITSHSFVPLSLRRMQYIMVDYCGRSNPKAVSRLDEMAEDIPGLLKEKDETIERCEAKLCLLDELAGEIDPQDLETLREQFLRLLGFTRILREVTALFFGIRKREISWSILEREVLRQELLGVIKRCRAAAEGVTVLQSGRTFKLCDEAEALIKEPEVYDLNRSPLFNGFDPEKAGLKEHLSDLVKLGLGKLLE